MTLLGWYGGQFFNAWIQPFDHWVAFGLLAFIGAKMIWESFEESESGFRFTHTVLFTLALATSIDAMGVGLSYSVLNQPVFNFSFLIAAVAFGFSFAGIYLGKWLQSILRNKMDLIGGLILIAIGIKLLVDHGVF
ncbi:manganese efflux pump [Candidatus Peregrinibacteria bacterium]|nr:MAG: manganese efflux pump [Candidatus Peregrinibacteria bacterium]